MQRHAGHRFGRIGFKRHILRIEKAEVVLPVKVFNAMATAIEKPLCPEVNSEKGSVGNDGTWKGFQASPIISCVPLPAPT